jgi:hypothetical protein
MTASLDISIPIRDKVIETVGSSLPVYNGGVPVFTRRPVPVGAPFPMVVISSDITVTEEDGIDDMRSIITRDVITYGRNDTPESYRLVEEIAYALREAFHRNRQSLDLILQEWSVTDVRVTGPRPAPTDDEQTVGRLVGLTVRLAKK